MVRCDMEKDMFMAMTVRRRKRSHLSLRLSLQRLVMERPVCGMNFDDAKIPAMPPHLASCWKQWLGRKVCERDMGASRVYRLIVSKLDQRQKPLIHSGGIPAAASACAHPLQKQCPVRSKVVLRSANGIPANSSAHFRSFVTLEGVTGVRPER